MGAMITNQPATNYLPATSQVDLPSLGGQLVTTGIERSNLIGASNVVFREVVDHLGNILGLIAMRYDGTEDDVLEKAKALTIKMFQSWPDASNFNSRIGAFDLLGIPKWSVSPDLMHVFELSKDGQRNVWGRISC